MSWVSSAIGVGTAAVGFFKEKSANAEAKKLQATRPTLRDSPYLNDQLKLAESNLSTGMSTEAKATYEQDLDRSLSTSLSTVLKGGGNANNVGEIFANDAQGRQRIALMKDNLRLAETDRLTRAQDAMEEERQKQFQVNEDAPWKDAAQATAQARQGAENMMWSGIGTAGSGVLKGLESVKSANALNPPTNFNSNDPFSPSNPNNVARADTKNSYPSPANPVSSINPSGGSNPGVPSLLDALLASNPI